MTPQEFGLLLVSVIASVSGQFFFKTGALKLGKVNSGNLVNHIWGIVLSPELFLGFVCYGLGAIAYILVLTRVKLTVAAPSIAISYVFFVLLGRFVFGEQIPEIRLVGLAFIIGGVVLVAWQH